MGGGSYFVTIFEYLSVAASIVLALGIGRLVSSIPSVFASDRRDWLHSSFVVQLLLLHLVQWWRLWPLHEVSSWNFLEFLIVIGGPISIYFAAHVLVSDAPAEVDSWARHFDSAHRWFFSALACTVLCGIFRVLLILDLELEPITVAAILAAPVVGALVSNRKALAVVGLIGWIQIAYIIHRSFVAGAYSL